MRSVRQRPARLTATLLSTFFGATIIMTFNSLHDTAGADGVDQVSVETLSTAAAVVGGYGTLLVFFAVASTLTVNVRQRGEEVALLRNTGATPAQISRMIAGEALVVALAGVALAVVPAMLGGRALLDMFRDTHQVASDIDYVFGAIALSSGVLVTLLASVGAALLAVRRAAGSAARRRQPRGRVKKFAGFAALATGAVGAGTTFVMEDNAAALMAPPAYGAILLSVGFAVFAPALLKAVLGWLERPLVALGGASGYLGLHNMRRRAGQLSGTLMPLVLFTGVAVATLSIQAIESDAIKASGVTKSVEDKNLETLNLVVVGVIVLFACLMLINTLYAETAYRAKEFGQQRMAGATPRQVLAAVGLEGLALTCTGVFFGTVAALAGIVPFGLVRGDQALPSQSYGIWLGIAAAAAVVTLVTSLVTARRALRTPAIAAVTIAA